MTQWLTTSQAAAALGISPKTVWRRARAGELTARKVAGERGGKVWEIALKPSGQTDRPSGQTRPDTERPSKAQTPEIEREASGQTERPPNGQAAKPNGQSLSGEAGAAVQFTAHLIEENRFLRATVEQLQRDGAEVRAALREALKQRAPQLPQGSAQDAPESPQTGAADTDSPKAAKGSENGLKRDKSPLSYGDIADELERSLNL